MIVLGSAAALLQGVKLGRIPNDVDLLGTEQEMSEFVKLHEELIESVRPEKNGCYIYFKPGVPIRKSDFSLMRNPSDYMLDNALGSKMVPILKSVAKVPSLRLLYLTKRSHINHPFDGWERHFSDMAVLSRYKGNLTEADLQYCRQRRLETDKRLKFLKEKKFKLTVSNEEFFRVSNHIRTYVHDDIHRSIAFDKGFPLFDKCKRNIDSAKLDRALFESLPLSDRMRLPQEEFMVIGIERFFLKDRSLSSRVVYQRGLLKTVRDLCSGWFQDFCIDNALQLMQGPEYDFLARFKDAELSGEIRRVPQQTDSPAGHLRYAYGHHEANRLRECADECKEVLKQQPTNSIALALLGEVAFQLGDVECAEASSLAALPGGPESWRAFNTLGRLARQRGNLDSAADFFQRGLTRHPNCIPLLVGLSDSLAKADRRVEAATVIRRAFRLAPSNKDVVARLNSATATQSS